MGGKIIEHILENPEKKIVFFITSYTIALSIAKFVRGRIGHEKVGFYHGREEIMKNGKPHYTEKKEDFGNVDETFAKF